MNSNAAKKSAGLPPDGGAEFLLRLETLVCDLHWTALHIGVIAHLLNARTSAHNARWTLRAWRHLLHDDSAVMLLTLRYFSEMGMSQKVAAEVGLLYTQLSEAKKASSALGCFSLSPDEAQVRAWPRVADQWRQLSRAAADVVRQLASVSGGNLPQMYVADARILESFLSEAAHGATHCVDACGEIALPRLAQRRRAPRISRRQECMLIINGVTSPAEMVDLSSKGVGLIVKRAVTAGQNLQIAFPDGRRLEATAVRSNGNQLGLLLAQELAANDPLFARL